MILHIWENDTHYDQMRGFEYQGAIMRIIAPKLYSDEPNPRLS